MPEPHPNIKMMLIGYTRKERSLAAPIRNGLITTPSMLATMLPMSFVVPERQPMGSEGLPPEKIYTIAFP